MWTITLNNLYMVVMFLILIFVFACLILLITDRIRQIKKTIRIRQQKELLAQKVCQYRLSKMLSYIGVSIEDFVTKIPDAVIKTHISHCQSCANIPTCDNCLRDGKFISNMHFCPNYKSLMKCSKIMSTTGYIPA